MVGELTILEHQRTQKKLFSAFYLLCVRVRLRRVAEGFILTKIKGQHNKHSR